VLMTFYGLTARDIAEREGVPLGTVKTRVRRGLGALRERLGATDA
jgi:DNA-directed RNA polymerase specialized sigma24 family protein